MNRLEILYRLDDLLEQCKACEIRNMPDHYHRRDCPGCEIYSGLREIGNQLERERKMAKLAVEEYQDYKAKGLSDKEIAEKKGISPATVSNMKKRWSTEKPDLKIVEKQEQKPAQCAKKDQLAEYAKLVQELSKQVESQKVTIADLQAKVEEWEHIKAACSDVEEEAENLRKDLQREKDEKDFAELEYSKMQSQLRKTDAELENHKHWLKVAGDEIRELKEEKEGLLKQNKHMRGLLKEWA